MIIRRINKTEGELVFELFDKYRVFYQQQSDIIRVSIFIQERLNNNESVIFVALDTSTNKSLGFTQLYPNYSSIGITKNWILNDLYVEKDYRKKGIGERLIQKAMDFARQENAKFIELSTAIENYSAQSLYEQIGFKKLEPDTSFYTYRIILTN